MRQSWSGPAYVEQRRGTITLIRCARCKEPLYRTALKGQPRQEDHEQGCEAFIRAIRVMRYADELKRAASRPNQGGWRSDRRRRRRFLLENAKKLSVAACEPDPSAAVRRLSDLYQAECQAPGTSADTTRMAEMLMRACQLLALGEAPAPVVSGPE